MKDQQTQIIERLVYELELRNYSPRTIRTYSEILTDLERFFKTGLENISVEQMKSYLYQRMKNDEISTSYVNQTIRAFKLLQTDVLNRECETFKIKRTKREKKFPVVLSQEEVQQLIACTRNIKHKALLMLAYSSGLRRQEVQFLKPSAIGSARMQIHVVFTIPACLRKLFYINQSRAYHLLFSAAWKTLEQTAKNPKHFGKNIGAVGILHTWGQTLVYHPHIHFIVPAGGLDDDCMEWTPTGKSFFLCVKLLSKVYRGMLYRMIEKDIQLEQIKLPDDIENIARLKQLCYAKNWVVYCEKPFSYSGSLIKYLGSYSHRVALSNNRILSHSNGNVTFSYKDNKAAGLRKIITLKADEFIRRFLQHVLPSGFYNIRYFGFMAMRNMSTKLSQCFALISKDSYLPLLVGLKAIEVWRHITNRDPVQCERCKIGKMKVIHTVIANKDFG